MLFDVPFLAATATVEMEAVITSTLHLEAQKDSVDTNIGNFRPKTKYLVHRICEGAQSYVEVGQFLPSSEDLGPTLVFVDSVDRTTQVEGTLRDHLKWTGELVQRVWTCHPIYAKSEKGEAAAAFRSGHCKIIVATESLTMVCNIFLHFSSLSPPFTGL